MVDYSKWDHIEISDDEDETHPNIDTPSLFRWRHQARVERMEEMKKEKEQLDGKIISNKKHLEQLREKMKAVSMDEDLKKEIEKAEKEQKRLREKEEEFMKKEKKAPKNVDTLSHEGFTKTIINKPKPKKTDELTEEEKAKQSQEFMDKYEKEIKQFGMLQDYNDSQDYLLKNPHLACDDTANYLALWCINLEVQEKHALMERVAHQTIIMQYILELAKSLDTDPKNTLTSFFRKIVRAKSEFAEYMQAFEEELDSFKLRVQGRAQARIEKAMKEAEEEERQERLGPGGLDPVEVFESLPKALQECFEKKNIPMLQEVLGKLPEQEARHWLKQCVDSGLWIPNAKDAEEQGGAAQAEGGGEGAEETYEEVNGAAEK